MVGIIDRELCTGCGTCYSICPVNCIQMVEDQNGFFYPQKGENCINCNKCVNLCPRNSISHLDKKVVVQKAFAALSKNKKIWRLSSSGGAFTEICKAWNDGNTVFFGATWDGIKIKHASVNDLKEIGKLCKSKYISSEIGNSFLMVKNYLEKSFRVVFCGTPCQIAGLKSYLGKEYENLLLLDLICHGVGSPKVFEECLKIIEKKYKSRICSYEFRYKGKYYTQDHIQKVTFANGKSVLLQNDAYIQLFTNQDCLRECCGKNCIYRNSDRQGDITIGDFKHLLDIFPKVKDERYNYSTIVFNNKKGLSILEKIAKSMELIPCKIEDIKKNNPIFTRHTYFSKNRKLFFEKFEKNPEKAIEEFTTPISEYRISLKRKILDSSPSFVRRYIKRLRG